MSDPNSRLSIEQIDRNFAEIHPPLTPDEALTESARCLYCFDAPCVRSCPTAIDIPGFIRHIMHRNPVGAAKTILDANIFGGSCARICPTEVLCEGACVDNTMLKQPVQIGRLQRFACDTAEPVSSSFYKAGESTGKRVAIIGAGPCGLTCAHELRKRGHAVSVFESREVAGGLNSLGIARYKLTTEFALSEVARVSEIGIDLHLEHAVDGAELAGMLADYDAVLLAVGLGKTASLNVPGENLDGVWESLDFIFQTHTLPLNQCKIGQNVLVIGGGNTAMDAANAAKMLGAQRVTIAYRRDAESMPAFKHEYELTQKEGIQFAWNAAPASIVERNGKAAGVLFEKTRSVGEGRRGKLEVVEGESFTLEADMVIKALGQDVLLDFLQSVPGLKLDDKGRIAVQPETHATSVAKLFAGGDCQAGAGEEVVIAVQSGKQSAAGIHALLQG